MKSSFKRADASGEAAEGVWPIRRRRILDWLVNETRGERFIDKRLLLQQIATALRFVVWSIGLAIAVLALNLSKEVVLTLTGAAAVTMPSAAVATS